MNTAFAVSRDNRFSGNSDPRSLFLTPQSRKTLDDLANAVEARKGLLLVTGETGAGKTTLLHWLLNSLELRRIPRTFIFNSRLEISELYDYMLAGFELPHGPCVQGSSFTRLNDWLLSCHRMNAPAVLIVDEAQGLSVQVLEEIRMLLNLQVAGQPLLQIVLSGQPELEAKLNRLDLRQLRQRIALRCKVAPFNREETRSYIQQRLRTSPRSVPAFGPEALEAVYFYSRGIPRVVNILCEQSLLVVSSSNPPSVSVSIVEEVAHTYEFDDLKPLSPRANVDNSVPANPTNVLPPLALAPEISAMNDRSQVKDRCDVNHHSRATEPSPADDRSDVVDDPRDPSKDATKQLIRKLPKWPVLNFPLSSAAPQRVPAAADSMPISVVQSTAPHHALHPPYIWLPARRPFLQKLRQFFSRIAQFVPRKFDWIPSLPSGWLLPRWNFERRGRISSIAVVPASRRIGSSVLRWLKEPHKSSRASRKVAHNRAASSG